MRQSFLIRLAIGFGVIAIAQGAGAYDPNEIVLRTGDTPRELKGIGIEEKLGQSVDLSLPFTADNGEAVTLGRYFDGTRPVLLSVVYYNCASLCNLHLNGVTEALKQLPWTPGKEFQLVAISMDHSETPAVAAPKKANYVKAYGRPESIDGWHFLTGTAESVQKLTEQVGFSFKWDEASKQFAHASAAILLTPGGVISRYVHGIQPEPKSLRLSLLEASGGKVGSIVDKIVMFCFHFDPKKSKYTLAAWNLVRIGAVFMVLILAVFLVPAWWRERNRQGNA